MLQRRNIFVHGLFITLRRFPAFLWTYLFNVAIAVLFSLGLRHQLADVTAHSLAATGIIRGFDIPAAIDAYSRISPDHISQGTAATYAGIPVFFILYFILVPGTLFCYQTDAPARLSTLIHQGLLHFWRFVRITILTLLVAGIILSPLHYLQSKWETHVDNNVVGRSAILYDLAGLIIIFLVASVIRLYFDLVEVYTVQLGLHHYRTRSGVSKSDRRVRRVLRPAWRTLRDNFGRAWGTFLALTLLGALAVFLTARISLHMLGQHHILHLFLFAQLGLFLMLFTRFWQRAAETSLSLQYPIPAPPLPPILPITSAPINPNDPLHPHHPQHPPAKVPPPPPVPAADPIPNPEPASPPLDEPDTGVFHHDPTPPKNLANLSRLNSQQAHSDSASATMAKAL